MHSIACAAKKTKFAMHDFFVRLFWLQYDTAQAQGLTFDAAAAVHRKIA
jgi:hypothetical protein